MSEIRLLFANIGWMTHYQGYSKKDKISGGGSYRDDDKHETYNFYPINGKCYGYVQPVNWGAISLDRIEKSLSKSSKSLDGILVIWIAKHPIAGGTYIVGWYKNATVFRNFQNSHNPARNNYKYNIVADENDCTLIPPDQRSFLIPRANAAGKGFLGQSNVWYADEPNKPVQQFRKEAIDYIKNYSKDKTKVSKQALKVNVEARKDVEEAAVQFVTKEYKRLGYRVISREKDNIGWDLDAVKGKIEYKLEVKGLAQSQVSVHITRNEHDAMNSNKSSYILCVVINAIKNPVLIKFIWDEGSNAWVMDTDESIKLTIEERPTYLATVE